MYADAPGIETGGKIKTNQLYSQATRTNIRSPLLTNGSVAVFGQCLGFCFILVGSEEKWRKLSVEV